MRASAIHSLLSPEHGPECVPLVGALSDELLEATDHALHHLLFGLATVQIQGRLEVDAVPPRRCSELCRGHEGRAGLDRNRGGAARHYYAPAEETHLHARSLLEVAEEGHDVVRAERFGNGAHGRPTEHDHVQPEPAA